MNRKIDQHPTKRTLAGGTGVGTVHLGVTNRERSIRFYREVVGLEVIAERSDSASLGVDGKELVALHADAARSVAEGSTGLYHLAIVVPSRKELARVIARLISDQQDHYPTDHVLTKSDYLWDPDGNGIEVYAEAYRVIILCNQLESYDVSVEADRPLAARDTKMYCTDTCASGERALRWVLGGSLAHLLSDLCLHPAAEV